MKNMVFPLHPVACAGPQESLYQLWRCCRGVIGHEEGQLAETWGLLWGSHLWLLCRVGGTGLEVSGTCLWMVGVRRGNRETADTPGWAGALNDIIHFPLTFLYNGKNLWPVHCFICINLLSCWFVHERPCLLSFFSIKLHILILTNQSSSAHLGHLQSESHFRAKAMVDRFRGFLTCCLRWDQWGHSAGDDKLRENRAISALGSGPLRKLSWLLPLVVRFTGTIRNQTGYSRRMILPTLTC